MDTSIKASADRRGLPLSFAQERLWFLDRMGAGASNNIPLALRLRGPLDPAVLGTALQDVVDRHEVLRCGFPAEDGVAQVVVEEPCPLVLETSDLTGLGPEDREPVALRLARDEAQKTLDLSRAPQLKARLLAFDEEDHALLLTAPHMVWDRWSTGIFMRELSGFFAARSAGIAPDPEPLAIQYPDFAAWQRERFQGPEMERQLAFWRERCTELPSLSLPTDRPRPASQAFHSGVHDFQVEGQTVETLRSLSNAAGTSFAVFLLAAWQAYLARLCDQEEVVVGVPFANRLPLEVEPLIGLFVNSLVMRSAFHDDPRFLSGILPLVRDGSLAAYDHPEVPFEKLLEELEVERDPSRHPLFQVLFSMQHQRREEVRLGEVRVARLGASEEEVELVQADTLQSPFDLEMRFIEHKGALVGRLVYDRDLFDAETITRMAVQLQTLLAGIAADPETRLSRLPLLTAEEEEHLLHAWNPEPPAALEHPSLVAAFEAQVDRSPEATALLPEGERRAWTYLTLDQAANRLAHALILEGVRVGDRVGIGMPRSCWSVVAMLGILKAGAAFVPIDPRWPAKRRAWITEDAKLSHTLTEQSVQHALEAKLPSTRPELDLRPDANATLLYTSGSTGRPKGVLGNHRGPLRCLDWEQSVAPWQVGEVGVHQTDLGFVDAIHEVFAPLCQGSALLVVEPDTVQDPHALLRCLARHQATRITLVPSLLAALLASQERDPVELPHLRRWTASGEVLTTRTARRFFAFFPEARLWNLYGATEVSAYATAYEVSPERVTGVERHDLPIGLPIDGVSVHVLDRHARPMPLGVAGELHVGGEGVAVGYWGDPEGTDRSFVEDPFHPDGMARLYRTGDLARRRPDGVLEFLGRGDAQVNVRGVRIELREVAACLEEHDEVEAAVVSLWERGPEDHCLLAHVCIQGAAEGHPEDEASGLEARLLEHLRGLLPTTFLPARFVFLDAFPRTTSGKVDHPALPIPEVGRGSSGTSVPESEMEQEVAALWAEFLQVRQVGRQDLFIDLGGHSLLAVQVAAEMEKRLGLKVPVADMVYRNLAQVVAAALEKAENPEGGTDEARDPASGSAPRGSWLSRLIKRRPS